MRFTISDETGVITLLDMLTGMCFTGPLLAGLLAPKAAGVVGFMIGIGVGLVAGVLAAYAMNRTVEYWWFKLDPRLESQPWVVKKLVIKGLQVWGVFLMFGPTFMMIQLMKFIVQRMAG